MGNISETVTCKHYPVIEQMKGFLKGARCGQCADERQQPLFDGILQTIRTQKRRMKAMQEADACQTAVPEQDCRQQRGEDMKEFEANNENDYLPLQVWCSIRFRTSILTGELKPGGAPDGNSSGG